jgi:hypothetical protein
MRQLIALWVVLLSCGLAMSQNGWVPPGNYARLSVPRISTPSASPESVLTPSLSLNSPSPAAGATNATAGNVAGAVDSTFSVLSSGSGVQFNQPLWYAPGVALNPLPNAAGSPWEQLQAEPSGERREFEFGAATFQSSYGVAQLAALSGARGKARRVYTNSDIARLNDSNGLIRYPGKMERVNCNSAAL